MKAFVQPVLFFEGKELHYVNAYHYVDFSSFTIEYSKI